MQGIGHYISFTRVTARRAALSAGPGREELAAGIAEVTNVAGHERHVVDERSRRQQFVNRTHDEAEATMANRDRGPLVRYRQINVQDTSLELHEKT